MIVVDSSVLIGVIRGDSDPAIAKFDAIPNKARVLIGDVVLLEVLRGSRDEAHARRLESFLRGFAIVSMLGEAVATAAAGHYRALRRLGITVDKVPDLIVATFCIGQGHQLLHRDRGFSPFAIHLGLNVL